MIRKHISFFVSFFFSFGIWIGDALLDSLLFYQRSFLDLLLFHVPPHEIYIRSFTISLIVSFGFIADRMIKKMMITESKLKESENNYRTVADFTFDWEYWRTPDGKFKYISPSCKNITGYNLNEFYNNPSLLEKIIHPDDKAAFLAHHDQGIINKSPHKIEFRIIKPDGEEQWIQHVCQPIFSTTGEFLGIRASNREISDRVYIEKSLEENIHFLQIFLDNIPNPIYYKDQERRYIACNAAYERVFGITQNEIIGKTVFDIHPKDLAEKYDEMDKKLLEDKENQEFEYKVKYADGSLRDVIFNKTLLTKLDGSIIGLIGIFFDITERKQSEKIIEISLEKYKVLFDSFPLGIVMLGKDSEILEVNKETERLFEMRLGRNTKFDYRSSEWEVIRQDGSLMPHEEFVHLKALKEKQLIQNFEMGFIKPDNTIVWLNVNAAPIPLADYGVAITFSDMTSRKIIEKELEYERFLLSTLMNTVPDNIYFKDRKSRYIRINKAHAEWFGLNNTDEIIGKTDAAFFDSDHVYSAYEDEQKLIHHETEIIKKEENELWLDGRRTWVSTIKVPFRDKDGYIIGTIGISRDITERKTMEKAINERIIALTQPLGDIKNITFQTLFNIEDIQKIQDAFAEATGVASIITEVDGKPITRPSNFCHLCTGIIRETEIGLNNCMKSDSTIGRLNLEGPIMQPCLSGSLLDGGASISVGDHHIANWLIGQVLDEEPDETVMLRYADKIGADKEEFRKALKKVNRMPKEKFKKICEALFLIARQLSTLAVQNVQQARNITERMTAEDRAIQLNEEITLKNRELEQIVYVTSHDLRSPLVNIQGFSKEIESSFKSLNNLLKKTDTLENIRKEILEMLEEDIPESLHYILASTTKMDSLLKGLLKLSRMGRTILNIKRINMKKIISNVLNVAEYQLQAKNIDVELSELPECLGDEGQIDQLFSNLIDNAIKYIDPKKKPILKIFGRKIEKKSLYCIEDNGLGIAPEHKEKIFEIFYRLNTDISAGEGIGLTITRKIVEKHNGKIWVESQPKFGSKFYILLPNS